MNEIDTRVRRGSEKRQKSGVIGFRASPAERAEIFAAAERANQTVGAYIRERTLAVPQTRAVRRPMIEREMLARALAQLGRANGNLHQIAKRLNFGGTEIDDLPQALAELRTAASAIMDALGRRTPG